jgi:NADH dehydrogenase FAD-containing subunit
MPVVIGSLGGGLWCMLRRDDMSFVQVANRKRLDRLAHLAIIGGGLTGMVSVAQFAIATLAQAFGRVPQIWVAEL